MRLVLIDEPNTEPFTADEVRDRLGIGTDVPDDTINAWVTAARQQLDGPDGMLGRSLITQLWQGDLDEFPCDDGKIDIPLPPLQEVMSVSYLDSSGTSVPMVVDTDYRVILGSRPYISTVLNGSWPTASGVTVTFLAGYGDDGEDVPAPILQAILMMISHYRSMSERNLFVSSETEDGIGSTNYVVGGNAGQAIDATVKALVNGYRVLTV